MSLEKTADQIARLRRAKHEISELRIADNIKAPHDFEERVAQLEKRRHQERQIIVEAEGIAGEMLQREAG